MSKIKAINWYVDEKVTQNIQNNGEFETETRNRRRERITWSLAERAEGADGGEGRVGGGMGNVYIDRGTWELRSGSEIVRQPDNPTQTRTWIRERFGSNQTRSDIDYSAAGSFAEHRLAIGSI